MKKPLYIFSLLILLVAAFLAGNRFNQRGVGPARPTPGCAGFSTTSTRWTLPIPPRNPASPLRHAHGTGIRRRRYDRGWGAAGMSTSLGVVKVNPQKQQVIGVQTGEVTRSAETSTIRALGRIAADENLIYTL